ncbi:putative HTH-type transcriptional regulator YwnA [compost metagenome]
MHHEAPNPLCLVGRNIQGALERTIDAAQRALEAELAGKTIAGVLGEVLAREQAGG